MNQSQAAFTRATEKGHKVTAQEQRRWSLVSKQFKTGSIVCQNKLFQTCLNMTDCRCPCERLLTCAAPPSSSSTFLPLSRCFPEESTASSSSSSSSSSHSHSLKNWTPHQHHVNVLPPTSLLVSSLTFTHSSAAAKSTKWKFCRFSFVSGTSRFTQLKIYVPKKH